MTEDEKERISQGVMARARSGLSFIKACLERVHLGSSTDGAYSRSMYILFSYNFELILKSLIIVSTSLSEIETTLKEIRHHRLDELIRVIDKKVLEKVGVKDIVKSSSPDFIEYEIVFIDGKKIVIQDFVDVRYDFNKSALRPIVMDERQRMAADVVLMSNILHRISLIL